MNSKNQLKGQYKFILTFNAPLYGNIHLTSPTQTNKITSEGNEFILRRLYNNAAAPINYIYISKTDNSDKKICKKISKTDLKTNGAVFHAEFTNTEMAGIDEIGLTNKEKDGTIITVSTLDEHFSKVPDGTNINVVYTLTL